MITVDQIICSLFNDLRGSCHDSLNHLSVKQLANIDLFVRPTADERLFRYFIHLAYVCGQGCCYTTEPPLINPALIGRPVFEFNEAPLPTKIAILDGIFASFDSPPDAQIPLTGSMQQRSRSRAEFIVNTLCADFQLSPGSKVAQIGVVGEFLAAFKSRGIRVAAFDLDKSIIGTSIYGTEIVDGNHIDPAFASAQLALLSAMSLSNRTYTDLVFSAQRNDVKLVLFAETAAHFAPYLINFGVSAVFSEPFPFYVFGGTSIIRYYRHVPKRSLNPPANKVEDRQS